jgi:hypothetical protein
MTSVIVIAGNSKSSGNSKPTSAIIADISGNRANIYPTSAAIEPIDIIADISGSAYSQDPRYLEYLVSIPRT